MRNLKKRIISVTLTLGLLLAMLTVPTFALYENTHVNTGQNAFDVLSVALTQLGYAEGANNETKYGAWYPMNNNPWCAMFVSWCAEQAGIPTSVIPKHASCDVGMNWFKNNSVWHDSAYYGGSYTPMAGDIIYFGVVGDSDHVGYVQTVSNGYIRTIEGNASNKVMQKSYAINNSNILGFGVPAYNQVVGSGNCGDNTNWILSGTGVLHMGGTGAIADLPNDAAQPWYNHRSSIKEIIVNSGITSIGDYAFCLLPNLKKVTIADTVTNIGAHAFSSDAFLTGVTLPHALETLGAAALAGTAITNITLWESVAAVGEYAFWRCGNLTDITVLNPATTFESNVFNETSASFTITGYSVSTAATYASENGHTFVPLDTPPETEVPETSAPETEAPETETPETDVPADPAVFTFGETLGRPGETVKVAVTLENTETVNSIALHELTYDPSALTFAGFADYEAIEAKCLFAGCFDEENGVISIGLNENEVLSGFICNLLFTVNEGAAEGTTTVQMTSLVKLDDMVLPSETVFGTVTVTRTLLGDINGNGSVDINDARLLFQNSMIPDLYPIDYEGSVDFNGDGLVDISDARLLFQYSMLPDIYPIYRD